MKPLRIGTRGSALALWQANEVARLIKEQPGAPTPEIIVIKTQGDLQQDIPLWKTPGRGFFTAELDRAQLANEVDIVVHSLKDLTTTLPDGLSLTAVLLREDPRDALVTRSGGGLASLPKGASVGTSSLRRRAFLAHARPDLQNMELRGNVPTRLQKLDDGQYDAILLATAGLKRLGLAHRISEKLPTREFPNAVAQGAIGVCTRTGDDATDRWVRALNHTVTRIAADAERALLRRLEGGCQVPIGALATVSEGGIVLYAAAADIDGFGFVSAEDTGSLTEAVALGERLAETLLSKGAGRVLDKANERRQAAH